MAPNAIPPPRPLKDDVLTVREIGDLAGVSATTAEQWRFRERTVADENRKRSTKSQFVPFPEPDDYVGYWPIWRLPRVVAWLEASGRPYDVDRWRSKRDAGEYRRKPRTTRTR